LAPTKLMKEQRIWWDSNDFKSRFPLEINREVKTEKKL